MDLFTDLHAHGRTIVMITHESDIAEYASRVVELRDGSIIADRRQIPFGLRDAASQQCDRIRGLMTNVFGNMMMAIRGITSNWLRTALTMLGVMIGVASVIVLLAIGTGSSQED